MTWKILGKDKGCIIVKTFYKGYVLSAVLSPETWVQLEARLRAASIYRSRRKLVVFSFHEPAVMGKPRLRFGLIATESRTTIRFDYTFQDPFFKIFANQPPVFIISFHLPEIPPLPTRLRLTTSLSRPNLRTHKLWPTPLPTNIVTPNRLYTSLPAPKYIYAHCLFSMLFYLLF